MKVSDSIKYSLPENLPNGLSTIEQGKRVSPDITIGTTLFFTENKVKSEIDFKQKMINERRITFNMQYGLANLEKSVEGLKRIYEETTQRGHQIHRFGLCLDRSMGLPYEMRKTASAETGLKLKNENEWKALGQVVPIQPHFGDHMIGSPASLENTICALRGGATTIGNISQYFSYEYAMCKDTLARTEVTIQACGLMAAKRKEGVMVHSNLDDGVSAYFSDTCSLIAWSMLEYYVIEELIGAKLTHTFGNLVDEPLLRMALVLALDKVHKNKLVGSMLVGNTISATEDLDRNFASVANYCLFDMVLQMKHPTGHAIQPLPITELIRIPSPDENAQIQIFGNQLLQEAEKIYGANLVNFNEVYALRDTLYQKGKDYFENMMTLLQDSIDITDPMQMLMTLKNIDPPTVEKIFTGRLVEAKKHFTPVSPRKIYLQLGKIIEEEKKTIMRAEIEGLDKLYGKKAVVATTDVHEFGKMVIREVVRFSGMDVRDAGSVNDPADLIDFVVMQEADIIIVCTYNGMALTYAQKLLKSMNDKTAVFPLFMGGRLNEDTGEELPTDVTDDLIRLGVQISDTPLDLVYGIIKQF